MTATLLAMLLVSAVAALVVYACLVAAARSNNGQ